jgi:hypothetical protein
LHSKTSKPSANARQIVRTWLRGLPQPWHRSRVRSSEAIPKTAARGRARVDPDQSYQDSLGVVGLPRAATQTACVSQPVALLDALMHTIAWTPAPRTVGTQGLLNYPASSHANALQGEITPPCARTWRRGLGIVFPLWLRDRAIGARWYYRKGASGIVGPHQNGGLCV